MKDFLKYTGAGAVLGLLIGGLGVAFDLLVRCIT